MESALRLWHDAGFVQWPMLLLFLAGGLMLLAQVALARKVNFAGGFLGWATAILALGVVGTAMGYRLSLDVIVGMEQDVSRVSGLLFKASEIALLPPLFALAMVAILLALQLAADGLSGRDLAGSAPPARAPRLIGGLAVLALLVSGTLTLLAVITTNGLLATGQIPLAERAGSLNVFLWIGVVAGLGAVLLGLSTVVVALISGLRRAGAG